MVVGEADAGFGEAEATVEAEGVGGVDVRDFRVKPDLRSC